MKISMNQWMAAVSFLVLSSMGSNAQAGFTACGGVEFESKALFEKYLEDHLVFGLMDTLVRDSNKFVSEMPKIVSKDANRYVLNTVAIDPTIAPIGKDGMVDYDKVKESHKIVIQVSLDAQSCAVLSINRVPKQTSKPVRICQADAKAISECK